MTDNMDSRVAVLEAKMTMMEGGHERMLKAQEAMAEDIHAIKELIATGKGAWWGGALILGFFAAVAGGAGALLHKLSSGQ